MNNQTIDFRQYLINKHLSPNTIKSYMTAVTQYESMFDQYDAESLKNFKHYMTKNHKPQTINLRILAINKYLAFLIYCRKATRPDGCSSRYSCARAFINGASRKDSCQAIFLPTIEESLSAHEASLSISRRLPRNTASTPTAYIPTLSVTCMPSRFSTSVRMSLSFPIFLVMKASRQPRSIYDDHTSSKNASSTKP